MIMFCPVELDYAKGIKEKPTHVTELVIGIGIKVFFTRHYNKALFYLL